MPQCSTVTWTGLPEAWQLGEEGVPLTCRKSHETCETDAATMFVKQSAATCLRFPERFKVLKVQVLIIHIICWEKTLRCHQHQSDLLSPLPSHTCNYRVICCRLLSPCLPILPIGGSHFCLAYIQKSVYLKRRMRLERNFLSITELLRASVNVCY